MSFVSCLKIEKHLEMSTDVTEVYLNCTLISNLPYF